MRWCFILWLVFSAASAQGSSERDPPGVAVNVNCATEGLLVHRLMFRFGETLVVTITLPSGNVLQHYANKKTGTWTNVVILNNVVPVVTCVIGAGRMDLGVSA